MKRCYMENIPPKVMCKSCAMKVHSIFCVLNYKDVLVAVVLTDLSVVFHKSLV